MSYDVKLIDLSHEPLPNDRHANLVAVLDRYGARQSENYDCYSVRWDDGTGFTLFSRALFECGRPMHALLSPLGGLSQRFCDFVYDFASVAGCVIRPDVIPPLTLVAHPAHLPESLAADGDAIRVSSGSAVLGALAPSYDGWRSQLRDVARQLDEASYKGIRNQH